MSLCMCTAVCVNECANMTLTVWPVTIIPFGFGFDIAFVACMIICEIVMSVCNNDGQLLHS